MTAPSVADMLGAWLAPPADPGPSAAKPAKPAKPANRKDSCGPLANRGACEALRIPANRAPEPAAEPEDSQTFAALRSGHDPAQSEQWRGFSQDSQPSQGSGPTTHPRACADCTHHLPRGTCAQPEAAGLIPAGAGFGIVWPEPGHADGCTAFVATPGKATDRPYGLSRADADTAHAEPWDDAAIGRFQARVQRIRRRGFGEQDADDLAERLHLLDVQAEGRVLCLTCRHLRGPTLAGDWRCGNHLASALLTPEIALDLVTTPQRCCGYAVVGDLK